MLQTSSYKMFACVGLSFLLVVLELCSHDQTAATPVSLCMPGLWPNPHTLYHADHNILMVQQMLHHAATRTALTLSWSACTLTALCHYHMQQPIPLSLAMVSLQSHSIGTLSMRCTTQQPTILLLGMVSMQSHSRYSQHVLHDAATPRQHHSEITQADHRCYLPGLPLIFTATSNSNDNNNNAFQLMTS